MIVQNVEVGLAMVRNIQDKFALNLNVVSDYMYYTYAAHCVVYVCVCECEWFTIWLVFWLQFSITFSNLVAKNSTEKFTLYLFGCFTQVLNVNHSLLDIIAVSLIMSVIRVWFYRANNKQKFKYKFKQSRIQSVSIQGCKMNEFNSSERRERNSLR